MRKMGLEIRVVRAGHANMFKSELFAEVFATVSQARVELYNTDGSQGAARGAGIGAGIYRDFSEAFANLNVIKSIAPNPQLKHVYEKSYSEWKDILQGQ
jgi:xylulokinase